MTKDEVIALALEALEQSETTVAYEGFGMARREAERKHQAAITALRAALAEPEQEPVECDCLAKNMPFGRCCKACAHGIGEQHE